MPSSSNAARSSSPANGSNFVTRRSRTLDDGHLARAESLPRLRHLDADDAAAEHDEPFGHVPRRRRPRDCPTPGCRARPSIGGITADEPVASTTARRASSSRTSTVGDLDVDPALAGQPRVAADQRRRPRPRATCTWPSSSQLPDDLVAPGAAPRRRRAPGDRRARTRDPARLGEHLARPEQRLARHARPVRALAADELRLDHRDASSPHSMQRPAMFSPGRAAADHDHVELLHVVLLGFPQCRR